MTETALETTDSALPGEPDRHPLRHGRGRHYLLAAMIGLVVGLLATAFRLALFYAESGRERLLDHLHATMPVYGWVVLPAIGLVAGVIVGLLMKLAPESGGSGIPHLKAVLMGVRQLDYRWLLPVKFVAGILGIGAGLSMGREGPTVQMGAAAAQPIAKFLRVPPMAVPQLLSCGAGAGLAAAFNAPLAGLIFVIEELHRELSTRTFVGALIASVIATAIAQALTGQTPSFSIHGYPMLPLWALPGAAAVGIAGGLLGAAFNAVLLRSQRETLDQTLLPRWTLPAIAGVVVGLVGWWMPDAIGGGHHPAEGLLSGRLSLSVAMLAALLVVRFAMTVLSYSSGAPGGIFAPILLMGAILGLAVGRLAGGLLPALAANGQTFAVLGMAAVFVGSVRAPLTGIVLICEMTANYEQLFALCIACLCAHLVAEWLGAHPIYDALMEADLHRSGIAPSTVGARTIYLGVQRGSSLAGRAIRNAGIPKGALVTQIERGGRAITPLADVELHPGDHISVSIAAADPAIAMVVAELCMPAD